ncbi:MAG: ATP-grasp domain-containing protein [Candidimonas sp.]
MWIDVYVDSEEKISKILPPHMARKDTFIHKNKPIRRYYIDRKRPIVIIDNSVDIQRGMIESKFAKSLKKYGAIVIEYTHENFPVVIDNHMFLHGSIQFIESAKHTFCTNIEDGYFDFATIHSYYQSNMVSKTYKIVKYDSFIKNRQNLEEEFGPDLFVKPLLPTKAITGCVLPSGIPLDHHHYSRFRRWTRLDDSIELIVSKPRQIYDEYRMIVINGNIVAHSSYRINQKFDMDGIVPQDAIDFAKNMIEKYSPCKRFVIDVGCTDDGWKIVELNRFETSGLYNANLDNISDAMLR